MGFLKFLVVAVSFVVAVIFLASGLGDVIPSLKFKDFQVTDLPIGVAFLAFSVAIACFWKIEKHTTITTTEYTVDPYTGRPVVRSTSKLFSDSYRPPTMEKREPFERRRREDPDEGQHGE